MVANHKILIPILMITLLTIGFAGCSRKASGKNMINEFPLDKYGYPKDDIVMVNGKEYPLKNIKKGFGHTYQYEIRAKIDKNSICDITLPEGTAVCSWNLKPDKALNLISEKEYSFSGMINEENIIYGTSSILQDYKFDLNGRNSTIYFKWANVNEMDKSYSDIKAYYVLKIKVVH